MEPSLSVHWDLEEKRRSQLYEPFDIRPPPDQERCLLVDRCLLLAHGEEEALQPSLPEGGALSLVLLDTPVSGHHEPFIARAFEVGHRYEA